MTYFDTSAKEGTGVDDAFMFLVTEVAERLYFSVNRAEQREIEEKGREDVRRISSSSEDVIKQQDDVKPSGCYWPFCRRKATHTKLVNN